MMGLGKISFLKHHTKLLPTKQFKHIIFHVGFQSIFFPQTSLPPLYACQMTLNLNSLNMDEVSPRAEEKSLCFLLRPSNVFK